ncbi:MAG: hypothetical protein SWN98_07135 [Pseudomonadota bacterium]|jgi:hypothetical protein|uniref:Uncharacterized protein n=1 Tax=Actibacterium naphthalenivorans TaxID=1614693 RepID=A0A840CHF7_9RHOB|nr:MULTISPECIES: hypothetical protein [Actibacterium]MBB4022679.1 hypothetical protein [Actibacterium naphthalenivorans]MDY6859096.1 hypothetical protein [Pseudomonadota bacterium]|tara:strand:+ start:6224 stop:6394 length:171 start_codon:yes stop_codon:yes gene_type:complete
MRFFALLAALALAACGADGPPVKPSVNTGIRIGTDGIRSSTSVGVDSGNVAVRVGL